MSDGFEDRELCPDGACIGVIGPDGLCKECGKAGTRPAVARPSSEPGDDDEPRDGDDPGDSGGEIEAAGDESAGAGDSEDAPSPSGDDWDDRQLCSDETCIGVIGADGRCRECGKSA